MNDSVTRLEDTSNVEENNTNSSTKKGKKNKPKDDDFSGLLPTPAEIEFDLVQLLDRVAVHDFSPAPYKFLPVQEFLHEFKVFRSDRKHDVCIVEIVDNTAYFTTQINVAGALCAFLGPLAGITKLYNVGIKKCETVVKAWAHKPRELIKIPPPWGFKSSPELCFNRLDYDPIEISDEEMAIHAPIFGGIIGRFKNENPTIAWIGSCFYEKASRKQVLWLYGPSGGGKSLVATLFKMLFRQAYASFENDDFDDSFWKSDLVDKRVTHIVEAEASFLKSRIFKSMTGDNDKRINQKFVKAFGATINTMVLCTSNDAPTIPNDDALKNRVIPCLVDPIPDDQKRPESEILAQLEKEIPYIVGFCMRVYREKNPNFGAIVYDMEKHLQPSIDNYESEYIEIFQENFRLDKEGYVYNSRFKNICIQNGLLKEKEQRKPFKDFILKRFPSVTETSKKISGKTQRVWLGITTH